VALPATAQEADDKLEAVEQELEDAQAAQTELEQEAARLREEIGALRVRMVHSAQSLQDQEEVMTRLEGQLAELAKVRAGKIAALRDRHGQLAETIAALQRIALNPPEAFLVRSDDPADLVRGAILLRAAVPAIESRASALREELDALARVGTDIQLRRQALTVAASTLQAERNQLESLIERKKDLFYQTEAERTQAVERAALLVEEAEDLRDLLAKLTAEKEAAPPPPEPAPAPAAPEETVAESGEEAGEQVATLPALGLSAARLTRPSGLRDFGEAKGQVIQAARGELVSRYGENDEFGVANRGIVIHTRPGAQVVAPFDGQIVFAGPFRRYGQILIIDHGGGYHSLVAGLTRVDGIVGQWVLAGEPVGLMGSPESGEPELYVELRRNGQPINPLPWLSAERG
jgi:septal ring factor EnvC (AmiA/AmiB activator)